MRASDKQAVFQFKTLPPGAGNSASWPKFVLLRLCSSSDPWQLPTYRSSNTNYNRYSCPWQFFCGQWPQN